MLVGGLGKLAGELAKSQKRLAMNRAGLRHGGMLRLDRDPDACSLFLGVTGQN